MKTLPRSNRILVVFLTLFGLVAHVDLWGQTGCHSCGNTASCSGSGGSGNCAFAAGESAQSNATNSICIGYKSVTNAGSSLSFGNLLSTATGEDDNMVIGFGSGATSLLTNDMSNSIMIGVNSTIPTMFFEDAGGSGLGNVGVGLTTPLALLHVEAAAAGTEEIARFSVAGISNETNYFRIQNTTSTSGEFGTMLKATNNTHSDGPTLMIKAVAAADAADADGVPLAAIMQFDRRYTGAASGDGYKPLFVWTENNNGNAKMIMDGGGNVGIGTNNPSGLLELGVNDAVKPGGGDWDAPSDFNLKQDISAFTDGLDVLLQFQPKRYRYNDTYGLRSDELHVGVVAQDLLEVAPYMLDTIARYDSTTNELGEFLSYNGTALRYVIVNSIKEMVSRNDSLSHLIENLNQQMNWVSQTMYDCCETSAEARMVESEAVNDFGKFIVFKTDPNPFSEYVTIAVNIPSKFVVAKVMLHDQSGNNINEFRIDQEGRGKVTFYGTGVASGVYFCSLVVDGEIIQTNKLLKTK